MSTTVLDPNTFDLTQIERTPFRRIVGVELRKSYDTRSGWWLLASMGGLTLVIYLIMLLTVAFGSSNFSLDDFASASSVATSILLPVLGILLVTSEWSQRTAITTFALEQNRRRVLLAKLTTGLILSVAVTAFALASGAIAAVLNGAVGGTVTWHFGAAEVVGLLITQALAMLGGFALATLLLNSPAAIVVFFVYKWLLPTIFTNLAMNFSSFKHIQPWIDFPDAQQPLVNLVFHGSDWAHILVTGAVWLALPFAFGLRRMLRAEVR